MSTGKPPPDPAKSFEAIARDPAKLRTFLACIGSSDAPSRRRAAVLLDDCESVCDVGCGPGVLFESLHDRRRSPGHLRDRKAAATARGAPNLVDGAGPNPFVYVGLDPVAQLVDIAKNRLRSLVGPTFNVFGTRQDGWSNKSMLDEWALEGSSAHALFAVDPLEALRRFADGERRRNLLGLKSRRFDGVVLRHVLEHLAHPWSLFEAAASSCADVLIVIVSQETRSAGLSQSIITDAHLGAVRWSHWRPTMLFAGESNGFALHNHETESHISNPHSLAIREELFCWRRRA
jgi:hypothetical protein